MKTFEKRTNLSEQDIGRVVILYFKRGKHSSKHWVGTMRALLVWDNGDATVCLNGDNIHCKASELEYARVETGEVSG